MGEGDVMTAKNSSKTPIPETNEYSSRVDRRRHAKQRLLGSPYVETENFDPFKAHEKDHHVQFRISPFAEKIGVETAVLFGLSLSQYCKAIFYLNIGLVSEPLDRRRKVDRWRKKRK